MNKKIIDVPENIHYLSDWKDLWNLLPMNSHFILNKKICGCGATEAFIRSSDFKIILASPRKHLLYNKYSQHLNDNLHLYRWDGNKSSYFKGTVNVKNISTYNNNLIDYVNSGGTKILTTYDSMRNIITCLTTAGDLLQNWIVVVDEFQSMFSDGFYKADVEYEFNELLKKFRSVIYLSATPFLESYLELTPFKDLEFIEFNWPKESIEKTYTTLVKTNLSAQTICLDLIKKYKSGQGHYEIIDGEQVISKEAVFYLNNIKEIVSIIRKSGLSPDEVNIICSDTDKNRKTVKRLNNDGNRSFAIGDIPGKGEPHKKFTFCTSTVYIGADFYSESAYSYVFANPCIESMAIDVSVDLQQILGRERLETNPFRGKATLFYRTKIGESTEDAEKEFTNKLNMTQTFMNQFKTISKENDPNSKTVWIRMFRSEILVHGHPDHYCSLYKDDLGRVSVVENEILEAADLRAWEVINRIYNNDFSLYNNIKLPGSSNSIEINEDVYTDDQKVKDFFYEWKKDNKFERKAKLFCDTYDNNRELLDKCNFIEPKYRNYHKMIGRKGFEVAQWREYDVKRSLLNTRNQFSRSPKEVVSKELCNALGTNVFLPKQKVKNELTKIYEKYGINETPKTSDLDKYLTYKESHTKVGGKDTRVIKITSEFRHNVSVFPNIRDISKSQTWDIDDVLKAIKQGSYKLKSKVEKVRASKDKGKAKLELPAVCFNGTFFSKCTNGLNIYSSFLALDFDSLGEKMNEIKDKLKTIPYVYSYFISPSGNGLKVIILHDNFNWIDHEELYNQILEQFKNFPGLDTCTKDLARGNFMSYDPDLYINPSPKPYHFKPTIELPSFEMTSFISQDDEGREIEVVDDPDSNKFLNKLHQSLVSDEEVLRILGKKWKICSEVGKRNNLSLKYASILCRAGVDKVNSTTFLESLFPGFDVSERVDYAYKHNSFGSDRIKFVYRK